MAKEKVLKKQASREQKFFNRWRRLFQFIITHIFYMIRLKLVYRIEVQGNPFCCAIIPFAASRAHKNAPPILTDINALYSSYETS